MATQDEFDIRHGQAVCRKCGSLVGDINKHSYWHMKLTEAIVELNKALALAIGVV